MVLYCGYSLSNNHYYHSTSGMVYSGEGCVECPGDTYHVITGSVLESDYLSSCVPCPANTQSAKGSTSCYTPCDVTTSSGNSYNLETLAEEMVYDQQDSFPDQQGNRFHYRYTRVLQYRVV